MLVGSFLKAASFGVGEIPQQPTYTIKNVVLEKLESVSMMAGDDGAGKLKTKGVLYFKEVETGLVLNRTNCECIAAMFGVETNDWIDKRVTLYAASVRVGAKTDIGIRVKGSPDLSQEVTVEVKLPRRKPVPMKLIPTGRAAIPPPTEALITAGTNAAAQGNAVLQDWWKSLTKTEQASMKATLDADLKPLAAASEPPA